MSSSDHRDAPRALSLTPRQTTLARTVLAVIVAGLAAAFAALLLGEYPFTGATPWVAGLLFGYVVAEIVASLSRRRGVVLGAVSAALAGVALAWAAWISSGDGKQPYSAMAWVAVAIAVLVAFLRAGPPVRRRSAAQPKRAGR